MIRFINIFYCCSDESEPLQCSDDPVRFRREVVDQSRLVKIQGCSEGWPARDWSLESLLERGGGQWNWKANFVDESETVSNTSDQGQYRRSEELLRMMKVENMTLRLFDAIAVHQINKDIREGVSVDTDKRELRSEYSRPRILDQDIFDTCQVSAWFLGKYFIKIIYFSDID